MHVHTFVDFVCSSPPHKIRFNSLNQQTVFHQSQDILTLQLLKNTKHHTSKGRIGLGQ